MLRTVASLTLGFVCYVSVRIFLSYQGSGYLIDDAYITLRYVQNLVEEGSLTFHVGDGLIGISTILYPLLLALIKCLLPSVDLVTIDIGVNIGLEYLCLVLLLRLFILCGASTLFAWGLSLATIWNPLFLSASQGGMETPLFVLWLLLAVSLIDESVTLAGVGSGLALLTRSEGAIPVAAVGLINLARRGKFVVYLLLAAFAAAYVSFYYWGYGVLYPASVEVKKLLGSDDPFHALFYFLNAPALIIPLGSIPSWIRLAIVFAISIYGMKRWPLKWSLILAMSIIVLNVVLYSVSNPPVWYWYPAPMTTLIAIFFFWGLWNIFRRYQWLLWMILLGILGLELRWVYFTPGTLLDLYTHRVKAYHSIVERLRKQGMTEKSSIFTHEIGALGYYSQARIIDAVGLINPSMASLGKVSGIKKGVDYGMATRRFLENTQPSYLVLQEHLFAPDVRDWDEFNRVYEFLFTVPDTAIDANSGDIQVYRRL